MNKILSIFILFSWNFVVFGQKTDDCSNAIYEASKLYENGDFQGCISQVLPCIDKINDKYAKSDAYRLLSLAYLQMNNEGKAEEFTTKMLKINPAYLKFSNIDPVSFTRMINSFDVNPKLYLGFNFGYNKSSIQLVQSYSTYRSAQRYLPIGGFQYGLEGDFNLTPKYQVQLKFNHVGLGISHEIDSTLGWKQNYNEQQRYISAQTSFTRVFDVNQNLQFFTGIGFGLNRLYQSQVNFDITNLETGSKQENTTTSTENRIKNQTMTTAKIGTNIFLTKGLLFFEVSYHHFLKNTLNDAQRYNDFNFNVQNHYVNDDVKIRLVAFNMGLKFPLIYEVIKREQ